MNGRPLSLSSCHAGYHGTERHNVDQHNGSVVPEHTDGKPAKDADKKQVQVPRRPADRRSGIAQYLDHRGRPFDQKSDAARFLTVLDDFKRHVLDHRLFLGSDLSCNPRPQTPIMKSEMRLRACGRIVPKEYAPSGPRFPAGCR